MTTYIWHEGAWRYAIRRPAARRFHIISDAMPAALHPATGQTFDSKSQFRAVTKAEGYVELGSDAPMTPAPYAPIGSAKEDIHEAIQMLDQGYRPPPADVADEGIRTF